LSVLHWSLCFVRCAFFFFNDSAPSEIYTLSLHDALPIWVAVEHGNVVNFIAWAAPAFVGEALARTLSSTSLNFDISICEWFVPRSEEHTSELQSLAYLVCRLLLEKKKKSIAISTASTPRA